MVRTHSTKAGDADSEFFTWHVEILELVLLY